ncbi:MAG: flagellar assembly peptidoglycan hydrolase FlgJ [Candidatus Competibacteraceae bacterium]|nr:flagellar assembly peptidoglycan hydrolase FlgJ [Candidatus Competibacteraceae bacterium]MCP5125178.1 flagellar assembly peptidoglycan hydrolase FlgJ [Gammaproteobacteria bacterium]HRX72213.1 flagellar assembly peptidoglycan hydrolase FlgJ [Candidatus Competibacteraceae bacterium]
MVNATDSAFVYTDLQGLSDLRRKAQQKSPEALREAAKQFEAVFIQMMLKSMRDASPGDDGLMDSDQTKFYRDMFDQQLALSLAQQGKMGLSDALVRQLGGEADSPTPPTSPTTIGDPLATLRQVQRIRSSVRMPSPAPLPKPTPFVATAKAANDPYPVDDAPYEPTSPVAFVRRMWPHAQDAARQLGVAPEVLIAQAAHETGWGKSVPSFADGRTSYNLFGIKAHRGWDGERVVNSTFEFVNGVAVRQKDGFRAYSSYSESFSDYVNFLQVNPRYQNALEQVDDGAAYLNALQQAGYATDPRYARKILGLMNGPSFDEALETLKSADAGPIMKEKS